MCWTPGFSLFRMCISLLFPPKHGISTFHEPAAFEFSLTILFRFVFFFPNTRFFTSQLACETLVFVRYVVERFYFHELKTIRRSLSNLSLLFRAFPGPSRVCVSYYGYLHAPIAGRGSGPDTWYSILLFRLSLLHPSCPGLCIWFGWKCSHVLPGVHPDSVLLPELSFRECINRYMLSISGFRYQSFSASLRLLLLLFVVRKPQAVRTVSHV
jgi:hypothetical protein